MSDHRFGKHPAKHDYRTLRFKNYLKAGLATPPPSYDVLATVYKNLKSKNAAKLFPMDGNDTYSDCTIAALAHAETVWNGLVRKHKVMGQNLVEKLYFKLTGGVDSGLAELDVLNYWRQNKVSGDEILAYVSIEPKHHTHIQQAIQMFGGVYLGFQCQRNCEREFNEGKPWTPGKLTKDGHAVFAVGYDQQMLTVLTWGNTQKATWDWWDECVDEAYAILPPQAAKTGFAKGFDFAQLKADLNDVAS